MHRVLPDGEVSSPFRAIKKSINNALKEHNALTQGNTL